MTKPPVTNAQLAKEIDHVQTALGDMLRNQAKDARRLRRLLRLSKEILARTVPSK